MIHHSAPHRFFSISELTRLIAGQLTLISRESTVSLACTCRCLEEPVLSTLWESQSSLYTVLAVLLDEPQDWKNPTAGSIFKIEVDPSPEIWSRFQRYASWMRQLHVEGWWAIRQETSRKLRLNLPAGGLFPRLQYLFWRITACNIRYADLFFSPYMERISIDLSCVQNNTRSPRRNILPAVASIMSAFPTSALQCIHVDDCRMTRWVDFGDSLSSTVVRCGPSLTEFTSAIPLSDAAVNHLVQLPHLHTWHIEGPPPNYSTASLPLIFPPLTKLTLGRGAPRGWLSLFERLERCAFATRGTIPLSKVKRSLESLTIKGTPIPIIDGSFVFPIRAFQNLVHLNMELYCDNQENGDQCIFELDDDDVAKLAMVLSQLESLMLGYACFQNTCATTIGCLLPISVHCVRLQSLEVHFNTTNIVDDLKNVSEDPRFQELRPLPRCTLSRLDVSDIPLTLDEPGLETVAKGMVGILPSLERCVGLEPVWDMISDRISAFLEK